MDIEEKTGPPLYINFVWNMHQPMYRDPYTDTYQLPWVRLHGVKSYYPMVAMLQDYSRIRGVFNLSPSLIQQILDYARGARDYYFIISKKSPRSLTVKEKEFILEKFFTIPRFARESALPAFLRLQHLKEQSGQGIDAFSRQDWRDLQLLHNLAWINPGLSGKDENLGELLKMEGSFSEKDKKYVLDYHIKILESILPQYRKAREQGSIELILSPYYHPILPLIIDTHSALGSSPKIKLPENRYTFPEDAAYHVEKTVSFMKSQLGSGVSGMWPSELAVSREIIPLLARRGFSWLITDEFILARTLRLSLRGPAPRKKTEPDGLYFETGRVSENLLHPAALYQPYRVRRGEEDLVVFFRDRFLSDLVGFHYKTLDSGKAAEDMLGRLLKIYASLRDRKSPHVVTIALDGENCWEHYTGDSWEFLNALYHGIQQEKNLSMILPHQFLRRYPVKQTLPDLATGSWNLGNLENWIGSPGKNQIWDILYQVRRDLVEATSREADKKKLYDAWEEFFTAQGSDFTKWIDTSTPDMSAPFEELFLRHIKNIYVNLGIPPGKFRIRGESDQEADS